MRGGKTVISGAGAAALLALATPAAAQSLDDRFWVQGAGYWADIDTQARVTSVLGTQAGTEIDFESDLDLDERDVLPSFSAGWRVTPRFIVAGDYYALDRSGSRSIERDLVFDDVVFPASATVSSTMATDIYRLTLGYAFIKNEKVEAGASLGLHATDVEISLQGEASVGGATATSSVRQKEFLAPLPTLGVFANWEVAPKVMVNGRVDYMSLGYGDYDGSITNAQIQVSYRLTRHVGVGAMYRFVKYEVGVEKDDWTGELDYEFSGPSLFLEVAF